MGLFDGVCCCMSYGQKDTKLDVITILTNLAYVGGLVGREQVKACLMGVSAWFDDYLQEQGGKKDKDRDLHKVGIRALCCHTTRACPHSYLHCLFSSSGHAPPPLSCL